MSTTTAAATPRLPGDRFLSALERLGNKLPQPFNLFWILFALVGLVGTVASWLKVTVQVPGAKEPTIVKGLFTGEGLAWFTSNLGPNFINFPPLVTVLPILLAIGIAEKSGFLSSAIRAAIGSAPRWLLPYMVGLIGVVGSIMADSVFVILPPLAALAFKATGRHPVAGLLGGFAAAGAGYSTSIVPTSLDALFAGITNAVLPTVPTVAEHAAAVTPVSNYWFNVIASIMLSLLAGFIIDRVIEPRIARAGFGTEEVEPGEDDVTEHTIDDEGNEVVVDTRAEVSHALDANERSGLKWAGIALLVTAAVILAAVLVPGSPWRNAQGGFLPKSPLLNSIVFIVFTFFAVGGYVYGRFAESIKDLNDIPRLMGLALRDMIPFLVLAFAMGQFVALFNWSGIGSWIAVAGADGLKATGLTGFWVVLLFIILCSILNLFIISGSAMWTIMAAVFVPMFGLIGLEPAFTQAAFRIGDSATQVITPMNPYMIVLLTYLRKYVPRAGFGTLMTNMLPFVVPFWLAWLLLLLVFYVTGLPLGPGNDIFISELR